MTEFYIVKDTIGWTASDSYRYWDVKFWAWTERGVLRKVRRYNKRELKNSQRDEAAYWSSGK